MHISKLTILNYRNFANATLLFNKGVNTLIGENGAGKTNLFRAIRLLLDDNMLRWAVRLEETDFHRGLEDWRGHWIILSLEFDDIGPDEEVQALFLHGTGKIANGAIGQATYNLIFRPQKHVRQKLADLPAGDVVAMTALRESLSIEDYEAIFTGRSEADFNDPAIYKELAGDFDNCVFSKELDDPRIGARLPQILSLTKQVSLTYIQALRDVVGEFRNNRSNPLFTLLKGKSGDVAPATMAPIVAQVSALNDAIEALTEVQAVRTDIRDTIKDAAGETYSPSALSIKSDLPDEPEKLFQSLRLFVGESGENHEGGIDELSLGGANLIFLTLKLLEFKYQKARRSIANFLLIEEPEAHIHTHIQKTLFDRIAYSDTQIIYSTHSTHVSEVSRVRSVNVLGRHGIQCEAYQPTTGLSAAEIGAIERYLDAVRSNLLFAKSVVLVEGDAEEILVPVLFKQVFGLSLDELGVSLINIRSTGFQNVARLFHDDRIRKHCSIITDLDAAILDTTPVPGDTEALVTYKAACLASQKSGAERRDLLDAFADGNRWLSVHYAQHTFEVDFVAAGNGPLLASILPAVYVDPKTIATAEAELTSGDKAQFGKRVLTMAKGEGKGWFALLLGQHVTADTVIPPYIVEAVLTAHGDLSTELLFNMFRHRVGHAIHTGTLAAARSNVVLARLDEYRAGAVGLPDLKACLRVELPDDQIHDLLAGVA